MENNQFEKQLKVAETSALNDLSGQWCVCLKYGIYRAFPLAFALKKEYPIVCITIY